MTRIAERLRMYNPETLMADPTAVESVFGSTQEMLAANRLLMGKD